MIQATVTAVFYANGSTYSRVWVSTASGNYNFDVVDPNEARKFLPGMTVQITPDPNHPPNGCVPNLL
jgi:hypothetical protein